MYVGNAQSGPVNEMNMPNYYIIEGSYTSYEVSGLLLLIINVYTQF